MQDKEISELISQESFLNYCFKRNDADVRYWEKWLEAHPGQAAQVEDLRRLVLLMADESRGKLKDIHYAELREKVNRSLVPRTRRILFFRIAAAASILLFLSIGGYFIFHKSKDRPFAVNSNNDIAPGGNKAVLTLASGKRISLGDAKNGQLALQGSVTVNKTADGEVAYQPTENPGAEMEYNTMTTPRAGKYDVTLSDGTKIWLDASSSIKYPAAFAGKERKVEITGQAYFEVAHDAARPFLVVTPAETVEVLGTHFNINAYSDEPGIKTTLLEGSVKVTSQGQTALLKPGQQAGLEWGSPVISVRSADVEEAIAWKNGYFRFSSIELRELMQQVSRWYDVDVKYAGSIPKHEFFIDVKRKTNLSNILKILDEGGIHFKIENRTLTVMP